MLQIQPGTDSTASVISRNPLYCHPEASFAEGSALPPLEKQILHSVQDDKKMFKEAPFRRAPLFFYNELKGSLQKFPNLVFSLSSPKSQRSSPLGVIGDPI